jgi:hypothetical protein
MKYKFTKISEDIIELAYKDKKFEIVKDVDSLIKSQNVYNEARTKMLIDLAKKGISIEDLKIKKEENGKTYVDESSLKELESLYIDLEQRNVFEDASKRYFNMSINELVYDIGLNSKEAEEFGRELAMAMAGSVDETPSQEESK